MEFEKSLKLHRRRQVQIRSPYGRIIVYILSFGRRSHSRSPTTRPAGFFNEENVQFIQGMIAHVLHREFQHPSGAPVRIDISRGDIARIMQRVAEERIESIPKMNQRVVMYICNDFRTHEIQRDKHMRWEESFRFATKLYDPTSGRASVDTKQYKLPNRLGKPKVGGTLRFRDPIAFGLGKY